MSIKQDIAFSASDDSQHPNLAATNCNTGDFETAVSFKEQLSDAENDPSGLRNVKNQHNSIVLRKEGEDAGNDKNRRSSNLRESKFGTK